MSELIQKTKAAIYTKLSADSELNNLLEGIFDFVPENTDYPYLVIRVVNSNDYFASGVSAQFVDVRLNIFSAYKGSLEIEKILDRLRVVLHRAELEITGYNTIMMLIKSASINQNNDGFTFSASCNLNLLIEEE